MSNITKGRKRRYKTRLERVLELVKVNPNVVHALERPNSENIKGPYIVNIIERLYPREYIISGEELNKVILGACAMSGNSVINRNKKWLIENEFVKPIQRNKYRVNFHNRPMFMYIFAEEDVSMCIRFEKEPVQTNSSDPLISTKNFFSKFQGD